MIVAGCCPGLNGVDDLTRCCCRKGSYSCSKCFSFLALLLLLVSLVFYVILAAMGLIVHDPSVLGHEFEQSFEESIGKITGLCLTVPPTLQQAISDNILAIDQLEGAGQDVSEYRDTLEEVGGLVDIVDDCCDHLQAFFPGVVRLFLPSVTCAAAILCSILLTSSLCCATGCCKNPPTAPVANADKGGGATWSTPMSSDQYSSTKNPYGEGLARA